MKKANMRNLGRLLFCLFFLISLSSCAAIADVLLGQSECDYPGCANSRVQNCNYCIVHCNNNYNVPKELGNKINQSVNKQIEEYKKANKEYLFE